MHSFCLLHVDAEMFTINSKKFLLHYFHVTENYKIIGAYHSSIIVHIANLDP